MAEYKTYFKDLGTLKNWVMRYVNSNIGTGNADGKMSQVLSERLFVSVREDDKMLDRDKIDVVRL